MSRSLSSSALVGFVLGASSFIASAQASDTPASTAEAPPYTLTGNAALVSDYRFRGISQSYRQPAVQAGLDYTHSSGAYLGFWGSSVSGNSYNNGASLETDLYGGYRFEPAAGLTADVGVLVYLYPGARLNSAPATPSDDKYTNAEVYFGLTSGPFSAKVSYAVTDYFGLDGRTASYAYFSALPGQGGSRGTIYAELNYSGDLGDKLLIGAHVGHTAVHDYSALSYTDVRLSLTKEFVGLTFGAALVATDADRRLYQVADSGGGASKRTGTPTVVLSVAKTF